MIYRRNRLTAHVKADFQLKHTGIHKMNANDTTEVRNAQIYIFHMQKYCRRAARVAGNLAQLWAVPILFLSILETLAVSPRKQIDLCI